MTGNTLTEAEVLAAMMDSTRRLTRYYLGQLKGLDMYKRFEVNSKPLNSAAWIIGHLTWAQNWLILEGTGAEPVTHEWLDLFKVGSKPAAPELWPGLSELLITFKEVHRLAIDQILSLNHLALRNSNRLGLDFGSEPHNLSLIQHCIRHEGSHAGHLSWICKFYDVNPN